MKKKATRGLIRESIYEHSKREEKKNRKTQNKNESGQLGYSPEKSKSGEKKVLRNG